MNPVWLYLRPSGWEQLYYGQVLCGCLFAAASLAAAVHAPSSMMAD